MYYLLNKLRWFWLLLQVLIPLLCFIILLFALLQGLSDM